ncbi:MAG TPA: prolyl aminopeptidase [Cellvibrionaceae bacterium]
MKTLYSELRVDVTGELAVDAIHSLYWEVSGNPDGVPVLFIHGGPGAGSSHIDRRFFDPARYRIVLFDQRGSGRSTPHAELQNNTTADLISDIEALREHLNIERWVLFGGSWGSTLGLLYAQAFPERVMAMILRGIFLCRATDLQWFYQSGADRIFPDYWEDFVSHIPEAERNNLMEAYYERLTGANELAKMSCAKAWSTWEGRCATLRPNPEIVHFFADPHRALSLARIEAHYFVNNAFIAPNQIIENAHKLKNIRGIIVHGRYDVVCPLDNAFALHQAWPGSELQIIRDAGHSSMEPSIVDALVRATDQIADELYPDS